jgi:tripartite-type tricarboxylate transporter receptor subunit TctC
MRPTSTSTAALAVLVCAGALSACGVGGPEAGSSGADYPTKNVRIVVPYAAGGPTDLAGRASADCLSNQLGQPFVVENIDGGAGAIGMTEMTTAKPDGYTLAIGTIGNIVVAPLVGEGVQYSSDDIVPLGKIYEMPSALVVPADSPYDTAEELIAAAEAEPGRVKVATPGAASLYHVALQRLADEHGVEFNVVPFDGGAPAVTAFLGGNVDAMFLEASEQIRGLQSGGKGAIVATGSPDPVDFLGDVPTLESLGYDGLPSTSAFFTLVAPAETPQEVLDTLGETLETCLADEDVVEKLSDDYVPDKFVDGQAVQSELDGAQQVYARIF